MDWDHEPETRKPFRIKARVFRFMESLDDFDAANWDYEPRCGQPGAGVSPAQRALALEREQICRRLRKQGSDTPALHFGSCRGSSRQSNAKHADYAEVSEWKSLFAYSAYFAVS